MLWLLKSTVSMRRFHPKHMIKLMDKTIIRNFTLKKCSTTGPMTTTAFILGFEKQGHM